MTIRVVELLNDYGIEYQEQGKNIGRTHVGLPCFLCGDDPSTHGGIHRETGHYSCWRDESHNMSFAKFISYQLQMPYRKAKELIYEYSDGTEEPPRKERVEQVMKLPAELERIYDGSLNSGFAYKYMKKRGFSDEVMNRFPLYASIVGQFNYRVIVPVYVDDMLVAWAGRTIRDDVEPRYKNNDPVEGTFPTNSYVGFHDYANRCRGTLFICEGPMDALKLNMFLPQDIGAAICLFGLRLYPHQQELISKLVKHYKQGRIVLDSTERSSSLGIAKELSLYKPFKPLFLTGVKDPGELDAAGFRQLFSEFLN